MNLRLLCVLLKCIFCLRVPRKPYGSARALPQTWPYTLYYN